MIDKDAFMNEFDARMKRAVYRAPERIRQCTGLAVADDFADQLYTKLREYAAHTWDAENDYHTNGGAGDRVSRHSVLAVFTKAKVRQMISGGIVAALPSEDSYSRAIGAFIDTLDKEILGDASSFCERKLGAGQGAARS